jgi:hypothetical protein
MICTVQAHKAFGVFCLCENGRSLVTLTILSIGACMINSAHRKRAIRSPSLMSRKSLTKLPKAMANMQRGRTMGLPQPIRRCD